MMLGRLQEWLHGGYGPNSRVDHSDLIEPTRELLRAAGLPYVIENVVGAPLLEPTML